MTDTVSDSWRYRCPKGHTNIRPREDGHYCDSCRDFYAAPPLDAERVDSFPVRIPPEIKPSPWATLVTVVEICSRPTRATTRASEVADELDGRVRPIAARLSKLETFGAVRRRKRVQPDLYLPTALGREWVAGASIGTVAHSEATEAVSTEDTA